MKTVDQLCSEFQGLSQEEVLVALSTYAMKAISSCVNYAHNPMEASTALGVLLFAAIIADDRISEEELTVLYPSLKIALGPDADMDECKALAEEMLEGKEECMEAAKEFAEVYLSRWLNEDKEDVIMLCIALCAIDGVISNKEKAWLKELVAAAEA